MKALSNITEHKLDISLGIVLALATGALAVFLKHQMMEVLHPAYPALAEGILSAVMVLAFFMVFRVTTQVLKNRLAIGEKRLAQKWQADFEALMRSKGRLTEDVGDFSAYLPVITGHLKSANECTETSAIAIMHVLQEVNAASGRVLEALRGNEKDANTLRIEQSERMQHNQEMLREITTYIENLSHDAQENNQRVQEVVQQVHGLQSLAQLIREVAKRINLLALNAAIEAARAGEAGRGFAVVADEVRELSRATEAATEDIDRAIVKVGKDVTEKLSALVSGSLADEEVQRIHTISDDLKQTMQTFSNVLDHLNQISNESNIAIEEIHTGVLTALGHMQFQDISRQQIMGVTDMIEKIVAHLTENPHLKAPVETQPETQKKSQPRLAEVLESHRDDYVMPQQHSTHSEVMGSDSKPESRPSIELF